MGYLIIRMMRIGRVYVQLQTEQENTNDIIKKMKTSKLYAGLIFVSVMIQGLLFSTSITLEYTGHIYAHALTGFLAHICGIIEWLIFVCYMQRINLQLHAFLT